MSATIKQTAKTELHELMVEMFMMIEGLNTQEGEYLKFADLFKKMNINIGRLAEIQETLKTNAYYRRYVRDNQNNRRFHLSEEQKRKDPNYGMCNCGRYVKNCELKNHLTREVHIQGRRNRKYAGKGLEDRYVDYCISREVALQAFIINHLDKYRQASNL